MPQPTDNQPDDLTEDQLQQMASDLDNEDFDPDGGAPEGGDDAGNTPAAGGQDGAEGGDGKEGESTGDEPAEQSGKESGADDKAAGESKKDDSQDKDKGGEEDPDGKDGESGKDLTPYEKARQKREAERQRLNDSWKKLDTEKEEVRTKEQTLKEREEELKRREEAAKKPRYGASDYERLAERYDNEGNADLAEMARRKAAQIREEGEKTVDQQLQQERQRRDEFVKQWRQNQAALEEKHPELKDKDSEFYREGMKVLKEIPQLTWDPNGINHAAEIAQLRLSAKKAETLDEELGEARKEIERLNGLLDPGESSPHQRGGEKSFDDMSASEQEKFLAKAAAEADRRGF
jgi:hypothetical protein